MKHYFFLFILGCGILSCKSKQQSHDYKKITIETIFTDSVSIRAIEFLDSNTLAFAGSNGIYGSVTVATNSVRTNIQHYDSVTPAFRAVAHTGNDFFMLSVVNPALLYKTGVNGQMELVYKEDGDGVFYDAMKFWNNKEGIAVGDSVDGCLSIIITRDGGANWTKLSCNRLPEVIEAEGAFAASNTNIEIVGDKTWIATTAGRIYYSDDKGYTWSIMQTPIINEKDTQGIYSLDFYDENLGYAIGGDFTEPEASLANKIKTIDGGLTWQTVADNEPPGYKSCVQYIPNSGGEDLVAIGFTGISYSKDTGTTWRQLSKESFYTIRFLNDSVAYAAGKNRIAKLVFR